MSPTKRMIPDAQDQDTSTTEQAQPAQEEAQAPAETQQTADMGTVEQIDAMMPKPETSSAADVVRRAMEEEARKQAEREAAFRQASAAAAKSKVTHVVVSGDTLSGIAAQYYSDAGRWPAIYEANKDVIGDNPNLIQIGQELLIPEA